VLVQHSRCKGAASHMLYLYGLVISPRLFQCGRGRFFYSTCSYEDCLRKEGGGGVLSSDMNMRKL
jgi:hypothetical protein